ncbi:hypothetical protein [Streptomyces canus]|uniref:hypothetical protein n=1 Tax=Streptomyces canus TaxID=58343 RepID=UPI0036E2751E
MDGPNSLADVFRFMQLRPARPNRESSGIPLITSDVSQQLGDATTVDARVALAGQLLRDGERTVHSVGALTLGPKILGAYEEVSNGEAPTVGTLVAELGDVDALVARAEFEDDRTRLSNTLLASIYSTRSADLDLRRLALLYRLYAALRRAVGGDEQDLALAELAVIPVVGPSPSPPNAEAHANARPSDASSIVAAGGKVGAGPALPSDAMAAAGEIAQLGPVSSIYGDPS